MNKFPELNLENFTIGYNAFYKAVIDILSNADINDSLVFLIPNDVEALYRYSEHNREGQRRIIFLKDKFLKQNDDIFLSFFNAVITEMNECFKLSNETWNNNPGLKKSVFMLTDLIGNINNPAVFKLDFYYDNDCKQIKRKLDTVITQTINQNSENLDGGNKFRYEECVSEFLLYKRDIIADTNLFYNESLEKIKKVVENVLQNNYQKEDKSFPKLSNKKQISNILFNDSNTDFENFIDYVIKNIHHEKGGQPKNFTEKEYVYLWLELNTILYLLNRYKK